MKKAFTAFALWLIQFSSCFAMGPMDSLIEFLEHVRMNKGAFSSYEGIVVSPYLGPARREILKSEWEETQKWMEEENIEFLEGFEKTEGDLAAVLLGAKSELGPAGFRVVAFGLRRMEGKWRVAPSEGSFANAGLGFEPETRRRARELENWMMDQRATGGRKLLTNQRARFLKKMKALVPEEDLRTFSPAQALEAFFQATLAGQADQALVWLGALEKSTQSGEEWAKTNRILRKGLRNQDRRQVWRMLTDPAVIRLAVDEQLEEGDASVLILFMTPYATGRNMEQIQAIRFHLEDLDSGWRVVLPGFFAGADESVRGHWDAHRDAQDYADDEWQDRFGELFEKQYPTFYAKTPEALMEKILASVKARDLKTFVQTLYRIEFAGLDIAPKAGGEKDLRNEREVLRAQILKQLKEGGLSPEDRKMLGKFLEDVDDDVAGQGDGVILPEVGGVVELLHQRLRLYRDAGATFLGLDTLSGVHEVKLIKVLQQGPLAVAVLQVYAQNLKSSYVPLWLYQKEEGWCYLSSGRAMIGKVLPDELEETAEALSQLFEETVANAKKQSMKDVVAHAALFDPTQKGDDTKEASKRVIRWRDALRKQPLKEIFQQAGLLEEPTKLRFFLDDLGRSVQAARKFSREDVLLGVETKGRFCGVSLLVDVAKGEDAECPLFIVAPTKKGPRVLADVQFFLPTNGGKKLRNADALAATLNQMSKEDYQNVKALLKWHEKLAQPAWDQRQKEKE